MAEENEAPFFDFEGDEAMTARQPAARRQPVGPAPNEYREIFIRNCKKTQRTCKIVI